MIDWKYLRCRGQTKNDGEFSTKHCILCLMGFSIKFLTDFEQFLCLLFSTPISSSTYVRSINNKDILEWIFILKYSFVFGLITYFFCLWWINKGLDGEMHLSVILQSNQNVTLRVRGVAKSLTSPPKILFHVLFKMHTCMFI